MSSLTIGDIIKSGDNSFKNVLSANNRAAKNNIENLKVKDALANKFINNNMKLVDHNGAPTEAAIAEEVKYRNNMRDIHDDAMEANKIREILK